MAEEDRENTRPLVSVVMPAYNAERFIEEAILSVVHQTVTDWELIVVDDCSQDTTCAIVERLAAQDSRIVLIRLERNLGVAEARNRGFARCRGSYIALLDSDDVWHSNKLACQIALARDTKAEILYCSYRIIDERSRKICEDFIVPVTTNFEEFLTRAVISCSTALLARSIVDTYRFSSEYYHEDLAFWLRVLRDEHTARGTPEVLAEYRIAKGTRTSNKVHSAACRWRIYRRLLGYSVPRSTALLTKYAVLGAKKYRRCRRDGA